MGSAVRGSAGTEPNVCRSALPSQIEASGTFTSLVEYLADEERAEREARELVAKEKVGVRVSGLRIRVKGPFLKLVLRCR